MDWRGFGEVGTEDFFVVVIRRNSNSDRDKEEKFLKEIAAHVKMYARAAKKQ